MAGAPFELICIAALASKLWSAFVRVVMLTDDVEIDRRILLEAESLHAQGHEVILLASPAADTQAFEKIGNVKVERVTAPENTSFEIWLLRFSALLSRLLGKLSAVTLRGVGLLARATQWLLGAISAGVSRGFSLLIVLNQGVTQFAIRAARRLATLPPLEEALVDRVAYYDADLIHVHDLPRLRVGAKAKRRLGVPLVYDAHELYPEIATLTPEQSKMLARRENRYIKSADVVITVNEFIAEEMAKRYAIIPPAVILNATNWPATLDPDRRWDRFRERFPISSDDRILLFQGWMSKTRGLQPLVKSLSLVPDCVHLVFMGYGEAREELESLSASLGLTQRIHFMDAVPQSELLSWTASADAGIIPYQPVDLNNYYSSPNKLFEFIQAGLPIIANDLPFLRRIVANQDFGLVHKLDEPADYAAAIRRELVDDGSLLVRQRANLRRSRHLFSWKHEEAKLYGLYETLLDPGWSDKREDVEEDDVA